MALDLLMTVDCSEVKTKGESQHSVKDVSGKDAIDIRSWDFTVNQTAMMGSQGKTAGRASFSDISITKPLDSSTPSLFLISASGASVKNVTIYGVKTGGTGGPEVFYKVIMDNVLISEVTNTSVENSEDQSVLEILETVKFNVGKVQVAYKPTDKVSQKLGAEAITGWDIITNKKA